MSELKKAVFGLVAGGLCGSAYGQNCDGQWLGAAWAGTAFGNTVRAFAIHDGQLIVGGDFDSVASTTASRVAGWNGATWTPMSAMNTANVYALAEYNGILYLGGSHVGAPPISYLRRFDGSNWVASGASFSVIAGANPRAVRALCEYQGKLVLGGGFADAANTALNVGLWDGAQWGTLGASITGSVQAMAVYRGDLIVGGLNTQFFLAPNQQENSLLRYDGTSWHPVLGANTTPFPVNALAIHNDRLIIGSSPEVVLNGVGYGPLASWDGVTLSSLGSVISSTSAIRSVRCLTEYNGDLVVGGQFDQIGGIVAHRLARWNGTSWSAFTGEFGEGLDGIPQVLSVFHDELVVGGEFSHAGGIPSSKFARWTDDPKPWVAVQPQSQTVNAGLTLMLTSTLANGYAGSAFHWQRNGVDIADGADGASPGGGTVSGASGVVTWPNDGNPIRLFITGVHTSDAGEYTVRYSNTCHAIDTEVAEITVHTCLGDLNGDGLVEDSDFSIFVGAYNILDCADPGMPSGCPSDFNRDEIVDDADFTIFVAAYNALLCP